ncbi:MAG: aminomethyl transferase family protein [Acidobacteria bacterium]|nr:aminomethyl transferase family protein [Acidobacteriota bacterium]
MSKKLSLHDIHKAAGASFIDLCGWQIVKKFSSVDSEYWALQKSAGLIDLSCSGIFELKGDDRTRFLHGMVTNDIKSLTPGGGCHAVFLSPQGRMMSDLRVFCTDESLILVTEPACREKLAPALRKYIIGDRPLLLDRSEELALLSLQGPKAIELLASVLSQPLSLERSYQHVEGTVAGERTRICRVRRTSAGGCDLIVGRQSLPLVWDLILQNGKEYGAQPVGFESFDVHRIEAGIPWYGLDMDDNTLPIEAGLEKDAISFNKGCYIGQESVARITYRGHVNRKLAGLSLSNSLPASKGDKISKDGQEVGWVTSSAYSPNLKIAIALGYLRREVLEPGTTVLIATAEEGVSAQVTPLPFLGTQPLLS